ncbi:MAG: hypothetical protein QUS11_04305 [Candidatus Fermentibacter sp.]|nr:hypothetical protein [Candidatus Fermentibacter sp.]
MTATSSPDGMALRALVPVLALLVSGCAYFNTFYNARQSYDEALASVRLNPDNPSAGEEQDLRDAIEGAGKVLAFYPDSRWADDAQMLIADALLLLGSRSTSGSGTSSYEEAMRAYSSVMVMTDDGRMMDRATIGIGNAAMALGRYADAAASFGAVSGQRRDLFAVSRLRQAEALVLSGEPGLAAAVLDTLESMDLSDSLMAETELARSRVLSSLGMPDSAVSTALEAARLFGRGAGYYRALTAAADASIEAGDPSGAVSILAPLRVSYSTNRELAAISLLSGRAAEAAGDVQAALDSYADAAELDMSREVGAEALYLEALLLEREKRLDDALTVLAQLSGRSGDYLWIRLASDRLGEMQLLKTYIDTLETAAPDDMDLFRFLAAEKRMDLYGEDSLAMSEMRALLDSPDGRVRAMALVSASGNPGIGRDSSIALLEQALALCDSGDLAGRIEEELSLPPGPAAQARPSALLEAAWDLYGAGEYEAAWSAAGRALSSRWRLDNEPALLWIAYLSSEAAMMEDGLVESYATELVQRYPGTAEGAAALDRLGGAFEEPDE